jgi:hypothetical protein
MKDCEDMDARKYSGYSLGNGEYQASTCLHTTLGSTTIQILLCFTKHGFVSLGLDGGGNACRVSVSERDRSWRSAEFFDPFQPCGVSREIR